MGRCIHTKNKPENCKYPNCEDCVYEDCVYDELTVSDIERQDRMDRNIKDNLSAKNSVNERETKHLYYINNKDKCKKRNAEYYEKHKGESSKYYKGYSPEHYIKNREKILERNKKWNKEHVDEMREYKKLWARENRKRKAI